MNKLQELAKQFEAIKKTRVSRTTPSRAAQSELEEIYTNQLKMLEVYEKMGKEIQANRERLVSILESHGLRLKVDPPDAEFHDTQLLARPQKTRLHHCRSVNTSYDLAAAEVLAKKYPRLRQCIKSMKVNYLDLEALLKMLPSLSVSIKKAIVKKEYSYSFRQIKLKNPECTYCGGKKLKTGSCKRCGLT